VVTKKHAILRNRVHAALSRQPSSMSGIVFSKTADKRRRLSPHSLGEFLLAQHD
jgi:hypothetical protein